MARRPSVGNSDRRNNCGLIATGAKPLALALAASLLVFGPAAFADEGLAGFHHVGEEAARPVTPSKKPIVAGKKPRTPTNKPAVENKAAIESWGPVPTEKLSLANVAPGLLPYFNNGPVFGLPGTVVGDFWNQTQLTGDWGGLRNDWTRHGVFVDLYTTSAYQDVVSGGLKTGSAFVQNTQVSLNIDTGRAGLWPGGLFHLTAQSRYGDGPDKTFTVGSTVPQYAGLVEPGPLFSHDIYASEYFYVQALSKQFSVMAGKISDIFIPDETLLADSYKFFFSNFNFNKSPQTTDFYNPTAWAALGVWVPTNWLAIGGGVLDPNSQSDNFEANAFNKVNLYATAVASYQLGGLPGQFSPAFNWSNKPKIDLDSPFGILAPGRIQQAVGVLAGSGMTNGLPINSLNDSEFVIANLSQYVFVKDDPAAVAQKLKSGQLLNGIGIFGRVGYAPASSNPITWDASVALAGHGIFDSRPYDSFGVAFYYNAISDDLKNNVIRYTEGTINIKNESGIEAFYDLAITPAIRLIPSYQHIWNPITATVATNQNHADVFLARLTVVW